MRSSWTSTISSNRCRLAMQGKEGKPIWYNHRLFEFCAKQLFGQKFHILHDCVLCSFDYENAGYESADLVKMDFLLNGKPVEELTTIVHRYSAKTQSWIWTSSICLIVTSSWLLLTLTLLISLSWSFIIIPAVTKKIFTSLHKFKGVQSFITRVVFFAPMAHEIYSTLGITLKMASWQSLLPRSITAT